MRVNRGIIAVLFGGLLIMLCQSGYAYFPNGIYVTAGGSYGSIVIDEISGSTSTQNEATLTKDNTTESASGIIAAIGYAFETEAIRLELAYAARQDVEYNVNPVFTSPVLTSGNLKSDVDVKTLMFNGYVDLHMSEYFVPYVTAGAGGARNRVGLTATGSGGTFADSNIDYSFAWQAGVGVHVKVVNNFFVNLEFHHVELGSAEWGPWAQ